MTINTPDQASSRCQCSHLTSRSDQSVDHPPQLYRWCHRGHAGADSGWTEIASVWAMRGETVKAADEGCSLSAVKCRLSVNELWGTVFHLKATLWFPFGLLTLTSITSTFFYYPHLFLLLLLLHRPAHFHGGGTALDFHWMCRHIKENSNRSSVAMAQHNKLMTDKNTNLVLQRGPPCDKHTKRKRLFSTQQKDLPSTTPRLCWNWEQMESLLIPPAYRTSPSHVLLIFPLQEWQFFLLFLTNKFGHYH